MDVTPSLISPINEYFGMIPEVSKEGLYYFVIAIFVISTLISTLITAAFLVFSILLWGNFKPVRFFWFLTQLTIAVFVLSASNLLINVPASLSLLSKDIAQSAVFNFFSYLIDFCHYTIIFSNFLIAVQRGFVFFLRYLTDKVFDPPIIYIWLLSIWIISFIIEYALMTSGCLYRYDDILKKYKLKCQKSTQTTLIVNSETPAEIQMIESIVQIGLPIVIFGIYVAIILKIIYMRKSNLNKNEIGILKQAIFVFVAFQASSLVFLASQIFQISNVTAFLVKRFVNTMEIIAGAATPSLFFFTSKEIRKLISSRVSAASSQGGSNVQVRGIRSLE